MFELTAMKWEEGLIRLNLNTTTDLFDSSTIARMAGHFENWLNDNHVSSRNESI